MANLIKVEYMEAEKDTFLVSYSHFSFCILIYHFVFPFLILYSHFSFVFPFINLHSHFSICILISQPAFPFLSLHSNPWFLISHFRFSFSILILLAHFSLHSVLYSDQCCSRTEMLEINSSLRQSADDTVFRCGRDVNSSHCMQWALTIPWTHPS